jgi:hypothetical protein
MPICWRVINSFTQSGNLVRSHEDTERQDNVQVISLFRCGNEAGVA